MGQASDADSDAGGDDSCGVCGSSIISSNGSDRGDGGAGSDDIDECGGAGGGSDSNDACGVDSLLVVVMVVMYAVVFVMTIHYCGADTSDDSGDGYITVQ